MADEISSVRRNSNQCLSRVTQSKSPVTLFKTQTPKLYYPPRGNPHLGSAPGVKITLYGLSFVSVEQSFFSWIYLSRVLLINFCSQLM